VEVQLSVKTKTGEQMFLERAGIGDFFGEISLLDKGPRTASARALADVEAIENRSRRSRRAVPAQARCGDGSARRDGAEAPSQRAPLAQRGDPQRQRGARGQALERDEDWPTGFANFSGSLPFLFLHLFAFAAWILLNTHLFSFGNFDPFRSAS